MPKTVLSQRGEVLYERLSSSGWDALKPRIPSMQLAVAYQGQPWLELAYGSLHTQYDLASLTKVIFTTTQLMLDYDRGIWTFSDLVCEHLPEFAFEDIRVGELLCHQSRLPPWVAMGEHLRGQGVSAFDAKLVLQFVNQLPRVSSAQGQAVYSDVNFWILGVLLEKWHNTSLKKIWSNLKAHWNLAELDFGPCMVAAPTRNPIEDPEELRGWVHDDNARWMGGVAPHAGLFGSAWSVIDWGIKLAQSLESFERMKDFFKLESCSPDWYYGFMRKSQHNSSCGHYFSPLSFGHLGFTGTSFWCDPQAELMVVLLTNRVARGGDLKAIRSLRPLIHDEVFKLLHNIEN